MQAPQRRFEPAVIERLFAEPYRFQYFQAVRLIELWLKRHGAAHEGAVANFVRFRNSTRLSFPASEVEAVQAEPREIALDSRALGEALRSATLKYVHVTPAFMGMLGGAGVLPAHYTERIAARMIDDKDDGPRAFLDTFSNRSLALFYEAWRKYRLELKYQIKGRDTFLPLLLSLAGVGQDSLRRRFADGGHGGVLDESIGHFAGVIRHRPASAAQIGRVLSEYFDVQARVEQFVGSWYDVPLEQQTRVGLANATLGGGAVAGERVWQRDLRLRIVLGPLRLARYESFLPGGKAARALASLLSMMTGVTLEYEVRLVLAGREVEGIALDDARPTGRLGWDTFLAPPEASPDRDDVTYEIHAI
jgi:type VI secretion system protein ImpH